MNLLIAIAVVVILASSSTEAVEAAAEAAAAASTNESATNDPLISKWPDFVAWYRSHGGTSEYIIVVSIADIASFSYVHTH
jgi:hypothetical protein